MAYSKSDKENQSTGSRFELFGVLLEGEDMMLDQVKSDPRGTAVVIESGEKIAMVGGSPSASANAKSKVVQVREVSHVRS